MLRRQATSFVVTALVCAVLGVAIVVKGDWVVGAGFVIVGLMFLVLARGYRRWADREFG